MFEAGVVTVFSSDWPISTFNPIKGLAVAVNRRENPDQIQHNPSQAVSVEQAISAYSANTKMMLASRDQGTLNIGQPFDALILNQNIFQVEKAELIQTKVLRTYKAGKELFSTNP
jgi:predicted amidohydrolase YtcJ